MNSKKFSEAMSGLDSKYIDEAINYKKKTRKTVWFKLGAAAACLALVLYAGNTLVPPHEGMIVLAYAYDTDEEITTAGAIMSSGTITDKGKMKGHPLSFYLSGKDIVSVRFSCKNQLLNFMDWTEKREEYGNAQNFTVAYGKDESEYYYLTIDWVPNTLIRELTDNADSTIATLPEEMRHDTIVMEITFENGETATKAITISLLDDGTFLAAFDDYKISEADTFVNRPDSEAIPRDILYSQNSEQTMGTADAAPMVYVNDILYKQSISQISYPERTDEFLYLGKIESAVSGDHGNTDGVPSENFQANTSIIGAEVYQYGDDVVVRINNEYWLYEAVNNENTSGTQKGLSDEEKMQLDPSYAAHNLSDAEEAARAYYANTVFEIVSLELDRQTENEVVFSVCVSKGGVVQEPNRTITLQYENQTWVVIGEGY